MENEALTEQKTENEKGELILLLKKEAKTVLIALAALLIVFKMVFYNQSLLVVGRAVIGFFWLFVLPGYFLMLFWRERLDFLERLVLGTTVAAALVSLLSYYLTLISLLGIHRHWLVLPLAVEAVCGAILLYQRGRSHKNHKNQFK